MVRAVLARALLARGDLLGAARGAAAALEAARAMAHAFPFAIGLETAVLVLHAAGCTDGAALGGILATAGRIRRAGDRPAPAPLAGAVSALRAVLGPEAAAVPLDLSAAVSAALSLLAGVTAVHAPS